ncbi:hypothetical protein OAS39_07055 [Pirellulales bacterium]|nr:hypothetical protein [Pirellulales bacterium]
MKMDNTILAVAIGSRSVLAGSFIRYSFLAWKESRDWKEKHKAEESAWQRQLHNEESAALRDMYEHAIHSLSVVIAYCHDRKPQLNDATYLEMLRDAHQWVARVWLRHQSPKFERHLDYFRDQPNRGADTLRQCISELAAVESRNMFVTDCPPMPTAMNGPNRDVARPRLTYSIDEDFRRQRYIEGRELQPTHSFQFSPAGLTDSQRELIVELFPKLLTDSEVHIELCLPTRDEFGKIDPLGIPWRAKIDPYDEKRAFAAWEDDYKEELFRLTPPGPADPAPNS